MIVAGLLAEDPGFDHRCDTPPRRPPARPLLAAMLWMSMPFLVGVAGWTGLLVAVIAAAYGVHLWSRGDAAPGSPPTGD